MGGANSYAYVAENFPDLWIIENNATYRGFISDAKRQDAYNAGYYDAVIRGKGALGADFKNYYDGVVKMGDTPSLLYLMQGDADDPTGESWGGSFVPVSRTSRRRITAPVSAQRDTVPVYALLEFRFQGPELPIPDDSICFTMTIDRQQWAGYHIGEGTYAVRYTPKAAALLAYETASAIPELNGRRGSFVVGNQWPGPSSPDDFCHGGHWFTDRSEAALFVGPWQGAYTILRYRKAILDDWAERWNWLAD